MLDLRLYFNNLFFGLIHILKRVPPHDDYDHMAEAINIVNIFKVWKVVVGYPIARTKEFLGFSTRNL